MKEVNAMRRKLIWLLLFVMLMVFTAAAASAAIQTEKKTGFGTADKIKASVSVSLPSSLLMIEDSAFEGTALQYVQLPEGLTDVGDRAFAEIPTLQIIAMPDSLINIGRDVLAGDPLAAVAASSGSHARGWARHNGYRYIPIAILCADHTDSQTSGALLRPGGVSPELKTETESSFVPSGRPVAELKASACTGRLAMNVRGRYFP